MSSSSVLFFRFSSSRISTQRLLLLNNATKKSCNNIGHNNSNNTFGMNNTILRRRTLNTESTTTQSTVSATSKKPNVYILSNNNQSTTTFMTKRTKASSSSAGRRKKNNRNGRQKATLASEMNNNTINNGGNNNNRNVTLKQLYENWKVLCEEYLRKPRTIPIPRWITPKHYQLTLSECFGHASFVLVAISYAVDDFLLLRIIAVAGSTSMLVFTYFHPHGRILWLPFKWNVLFILINSYRIGKVLWSQYASQYLLPNELIELRKKHFYLMDIVDYYRLVKIAEIKEYKKGDLLYGQGEPNRYVRMVISGKCRVLRNGQLTYYLYENNYMSEAGIHVGLLLPGKIESCGSVVADGGATDNDNITRVLCWDRTELVHLMELYPGLRRSLKAILSWDIVRKLKSQRALLIDDNDTTISNNPEEWTERRKEQSMHRYAAILHAILLQNPKNTLLKQYRPNITKYRLIHHIDDDTHAKALAECGWTVQEYESGIRKRRHSFDDVDDDDDYVILHSSQQNDDDENHYKDWKWYIQDIYLRIFG